jgi:hypothetical protein
MFDPKASKRPKPKTLAGPKSTLPETAAFSVPVPSQDQIRERAYQLYERRGRQDGRDQQDWLTAEQQILNQHR